MITVSELITHPIFKDFRLVSDRSGLYNMVRNSGIFEWETGDEIDKEFHAGDFVITTLSSYRNMPESIDLVLKALLRKRIAALCVKDIYFSQVSSDVIDLANAMHVPFFFFSETNFEDIIFSVKSALTPEEINLSAVQNMRKILYEAADDLETELLSKEINQYFHSDFICAFLLPRDLEHSEITVSAFSNKYKNKVGSVHIPADISYSLLRFSQGISLIYTGNRKHESLRAGILALLPELGLDSSTFALGISRPYHGLSNLGISFKESVYASVTSHLDNLELCDFGTFEITRFLCPLRNELWVSNYYNEMIGKLKDYDAKHNINLLNTIIAYTHCDGDIKETAEKTFQHSNTVRYRLAKAMEVLGVPNNARNIAQLYTLVRLHEISEIFSSLRI